MSSTGKTPDYIRHTFKVTNELKSYSIYEFVTVEKGNNLLTDILRIEKFRGKSNALNITEYLRIRNSTSWSKCLMVTGLRPATKIDLFYGDWLKTNVLGNTLKHLLIFRFSKNRQYLFIDIYRGFYPNHQGILQNIINTY